MKAVWNGAVIAESDDTVVVEGKHYFPANAVRSRYIRPSEHRTTCYWKGEARYYDVVVEGQVNKNAAWYYPQPLSAAAHVRGRVGFWHGVQVVP